MSQLKLKPLPEDRVPSFALERYFALYEFSAPFLLCCSDGGQTLFLTDKLVEALTMKDVMPMIEKDAQLTDLWQNLSFGYTESQGKCKINLVF